MLYTYYVCYSGHKLCYPEFCFQRLSECFAVAARCCIYFRPWSRSPGDLPVSLGHPNHMGNGWGPCPGYNPENLCAAVKRCVTIFSEFLGRSPYLKFQQEEFQCHEAVLRFTCEKKGIVSRKEKSLEWNFTCFKFQISFLVLARSLQTWSNLLHSFQ